jgi:hypothetical protein
MANAPVSSTVTATAGGGVTLISMALEYALDGFPKPVPAWALTLLATGVAWTFHIGFNLLKKRNPDLAQVIVESTPAPAPGASSPGATL